MHLPPYVPFSLSQVKRFFEAKIHSNPSDRNLDWLIDLSMQPLQIVYNYKAVASLIKFFEVKSDDEIFGTLAVKDDKSLFYRINGCYRMLHRSN